VRGLLHVLREASSDKIPDSARSADPRGVIPAAVVNKALVRGKEQLKEMRRVMVELG